MEKSKLELQKRNMTGCANDLEALVSYLSSLLIEIVSTAAVTTSPRQTSARLVGRQYLQTARMQGPCDGYASLSHGRKRNRLDQQ
jgi:hypothetical protein